tara:strand:+ start:545 stop:1420 length:876 start_codon:yes stop_codon:yes gene_type:complete
MNSFFINIRFLIEFLFVKLIFFILYLFPVSFSSKIGGFIFRLFGRLSKRHLVAIKNCKHVFPNLSDKEIEKIILKSWENLGKTVFELTILKKIIKTKSIETKGIENINKILKSKTSSIFFSIHHSNWEICTPLLDNIGLEVGAIYRHINNELIDNFVLNQRNRSLKNKGSFYTPKGKQSAKDIIEAVNNNKSIFLLIDQKDSAGENVTLFNKQIKTQTGFLKIARKYKMPLVPMENIRQKNGKFVIIFHKPIYYYEDQNSDVEMMERIHNIIEKWILSNPTQWFWQHNRFN